MIPFLAATGLACIAAAWIISTKARLGVGR